MFNTMCQYETNTVNAWQPSTHNNHPFRNVTYNGINKTSQNIFRPETVERQESFSPRHAHGHFEKWAHCYKKVPNVADNLWGLLGVTKGTLRCIVKRNDSQAMWSRVENNTRWTVEKSWEAVLPDEGLTNPGKGHPTFCPLLKSTLKTLRKGGGELLRLTHT